MEQHAEEHGEEHHDDEEHEGEDHEGEDHDEHEGHSEEPTLFTNDATEFGMIFDLSNDKRTQKISMKFAEEEMAIAGEEAFMRPSISEEFTIGYFMDHQSLIVLQTSVIILLVYYHFFLDLDYKFLYFHYQINSSTFQIVIHE